MQDSGSASLQSAGQQNRNERTESNKVGNTAGAIYVKSGLDC